MSIDDLSRTLDVDDNEFKILLEIVIANLAETRALSILIIELSSQKNPEVLKTYKQVLHQHAENARHEIVAALYKRFGHLPDDLFDQP